MPNLRDQWQAHIQARAALLTNALKTTDEWIAGMRDAELGPVGQQFQDNVTRSGCTQEIDIRQTGSVAVYTSFSYWKREGFVNHLTCGPAGEEDLAQLFSSKVHELAHAIQKMLSAALHASPFNPNTNIVICPRDWAMLEERCEQNAYVVQALFNSLLAHELRAEVEARTRDDALNVEEFERIRHNNGSIQEAVTNAAGQVLDKIHSADGSMTFRNHYQQLALNNYERGMNTRQNFYNESGWVFVRLEPEDIEAIGATISANCFMHNGEIAPQFLKHAPMLPEQQQKLAALNERFGIDENNIPTLGQVLAERGMTRTQFIAQSYKKPDAQRALTAPIP